MCRRIEEIERIGQYFRIETSPSNKTRCVGRIKGIKLTETTKEVPKETFSVYMVQLFNSFCHRIRE